VAACMASLAALLYFVGFLQNWTPKGIDTGSAANTPRAVVANVALLMLFGLVHSLMARPFFKQSLRRMAPEKLERSLYILVASVQLAMVVVFWTPLPAPLWTIDAHWGTVAILSVFALGNLLLVWAILCIDPWHFFGLRQVFSPAAVEPPFSMRGPYRHVRHPIQVGLIIALWATPSMTAGHALLAGTLTLYSITATLFLEERDLVNTIGPAYRMYRSKVPALVPFWLLRRRR
jgi:protein-S-isoprenylcysteine O-methyltransferase Ste14